MYTKTKTRFENSIRPCHRVQNEFVCSDQLRTGPGIQQLGYAISVFSWNPGSRRNWIHFGDILVCALRFVLCYTLFAGLVIEYIISCTFDALGCWWYTRCFGLTIACTIPITRYAQHWKAGEGTQLPRQGARQLVPTEGPAHRDGRVNTEGGRGSKGVK